MTRSTRLACGLLAAICIDAFGSDAPASAIYRCGNEYGSAPCAGGRLVDPGPAITPAQRAEARRAALDERRLAEQMTRDRRADEASIHPARAGSFDPVKARIEAKTAGAPTRQKSKKRPPVPGNGDFVAHVPKVKVAKT